MARLPHPGGDSDRWGGILNEFLLHEHNSDGTHDTAALLAMPNTAGRVLVSAPGLHKDVQWQQPNKQLVGLANVDNTADIDKPISTATQTVLDSLESAKANDVNVVHKTGNESIAGDKDFTGSMQMTLQDITPGIPLTNANGVWRLVGGDGTTHMAFFKDMDGDGDYDADIWFKDNGYLVATNTFHLRPGYSDGGVEKGRVVIVSELDETTGLGVNYIQSGRNFSGTTFNDLVFSRYKSSFRWLVLDESQNGYAGFGLTGGTTPDDALARIHAKDGATTIALFEGTNESGTARIALKDITTSSGSAVTVGAFGDFMILRAGSTNSARLSSLGLYVGGNVTPTARLDITASSTTAASIRIRAGSAPTAPNDGDMWYDGTNVSFRAGALTQVLATKAYADSGGWTSVPATSTSSGIAGQKAYDGTNLYVCVAANTWRRTALSSW